MQIMEDRRALHRIPEPDKDLPRTLQYLQNALEPLSCYVFSPMEGALCAWFDNNASHTVAIRSDADALPITEATGKPYASLHPGYMHACGHDGHMAILLELARRISGKPLNRNVLLIFQPAEETTGGAKLLCDTGILDAYHVEAIFGMHLWPGLEKGVIASRKKEMLSRSCEVTVEILGRSAHIAKACEGLDALAAAVDFYRRACALERALPDHVFRLLKFGRMDSGTVRNAVSDKTVLEGSLRTFSNAVFETLRKGLVSIGTEIERETGCAVSITTSDGYPPVINHPQLYEKVRSIVAFRELDAPSMITEDFSWYQQFVPGVFFFLGVGDTPALHAADFDFDESVLLRGADFYETLLENYS